MTWDDLFVQGFERVDRQLLDAAALAGHLVPAGSMFAFLAAHRAEVFPDADYADLFASPGVGRPSLPATQMAAVLTLQALYDCSDREAAEAARFDVRWKVAIGASLDDRGFDPSSLVYWRNRIARTVTEDRVISTVDPEARHTHKSPEARRDGYRAHVAAEPETGIITGEKLTKAAGPLNSDPAVAAEFVAADVAGDGDVSQDEQNRPAWYADSAYGTGDLRDAIERAGHRAVIKPTPLRVPVADGFTVDDFTVDEQRGTVHHL